MQRKMFSNHKMCFFIGMLAVIFIYALVTVFHDGTFDEWRLETRRFFFQPRRLPDRFNAETKKILFWNSMWRNENFYLGHDDLFIDCPQVNNCWATHDRSQFPVEDFDALLFHGSELNAHDIPEYRKKEQNYIFANLESPANYPIGYRIFDDDFFNLTMTYRLDSDIVFPYNNVRNIADNSIVAPKIDVDWKLNMTGTETGTRKSTWNDAAMSLKRKQKTKTAIWFVSHCQTQSGRDNYVKKLAMHVDVDIYGSCGNAAGCPRSRNCFREVVEPHYYFYLSFENSLCQDYVTEKFYDALRHHVVPIVYGGANYTRFAPPGSFINALDFDSPKALANYLESLIAQPMKYDKFFEWKKYYEIIQDNRRVACQLCELLHQKLKPKSYSPLSAWYENNKCHSPREY